jgi:(p)ppGpp synthase/HD superfamily hydrolase
MFSPDRYVQAMRFAASKHNAQKEPGHDLPYLVHVVSVAAEVIAVLPIAGLANPDLAVLCALLHDTVEDTPTTLDEITERFGADVAAGVSALTKNDTLEKAEQMPDSLRRILEQPPEIAAVKLADRTINMQEPPHYWSKDKRIAYREQALVIADTLGARCPVLEARLRSKIASYGAFC